MTRIKGQLTTAEVLPYNEFKRFLKGLDDDRKYHWEAYCLVSFCTGLRASDVRTLKWADILDKDEMIKLEKKTGKVRIINFGIDVKKRIKELYSLNGNPDKNLPILYNSKERKPFSLEYINRKLKDFRVRYNLPIKAFSTHTFRKTFGRYVYETMGRSAESLILLSSLFKHTSTKTTEAYIGLTREDFNKVYTSIKL